MARNELFARSRISEVDRRILALSEASSPSVIRIRIEGMKGDQVARIINRVQEAASIDLEEGVAITVTEPRIAIRRLPLSANLANISRGNADLPGATSQRSLRRV